MSNYMTLKGGGGGRERGDRKRAGRIDMERVEIGRKGGGVREGR